MTSGLDKENATAEIDGAQPFASNAKSAMRDKKSRSKSLGPGGLDALQHSNGNRRQVLTENQTYYTYAYKILTQAHIVYGILST